jgi:hypothetical protein
MIRKLLFSLLLVSLSVPSFAGSDNSPVGARSAGIANASVTLGDVWSTHHNQAGLGFVKNAGASVYYESRFMMKELSLKAGVLAYPIKAGTFGLSVSSFGYTNYSENKIGIAFGKALGENFSAGIQLDYLSTHIGENYGKSSAFAGEIGIQAKPWKNLTVGAHLFNPTRAKLADYNNERTPTILRLGIDYKFSDKVFVAVETEKDIDHKAVFKTGLEYHPAEVLYLRAGISTNPALSSFGFGLKLKQFRLDFASSFHSVLGYTPQMGLLYEMK